MRSLAIDIHDLGTETAEQANKSINKVLETIEHELRSGYAVSDDFVRGVMAHEFLHGCLYAEDFEQVFEAAKKLTV